MVNSFRSACLHVGCMTAKKKKTLVKITFQWSSVRCLCRVCLNHTVQKDSRGVLGTSFRLKSAKHMVESKTKSISSLGAFFNFSKTARSIYNFLKISAWKWSGRYLFCYGAWAQKESAKLVKLVYPVRNLYDSSKSLDDRPIKVTWKCRQSRFFFPDSSRKYRSDSASKVPILLAWTDPRSSKCYATFLEG